MATGPLPAYSRSKIEMAELQRYGVIEMNDEIGLLVAIGVALDPAVGFRLDIMQLARFAAESVGADEMEILGARFLRIRIPAGQVDAVLVGEP